MYKRKKIVNDRSGRFISSEIWVAIIFGWPLHYKSAIIRYMKGKTGKILM